MMNVVRSVLIEKISDKSGNVEVDSSSDDGTAATSSSNRTEKDDDDYGVTVSKMSSDADLNFETECN